MKSNFNDCFNHLLKDEGGYSNVPGDNGGPTKYGITLKDYRLHINPNGTANDVKNLTTSQAGSVYKSKYWDALGCNDLASGVDYTCFDYGVLAGLGRPRKALQRFKSLSGTSLIDAINNERTTFLKALAASQEHDRQFLKGWLGRVERVRAYSKVLAKKDNTTGPAIGGSFAAFFAAISQYWHQHETAIIIGGLLSAIIIGTIVHMYRNKGK